MVIVCQRHAPCARGEQIQRPAPRRAAEPRQDLENIPSPFCGARKSRWPGRQRLLPMQVATSETHPLCIMQRMPPLLASATPHPSPETNHCRAPACTAPPPPSRAARSHGAAPAAARRLLKGGRRPLKAPWGGARRSAAAPFPAGARGAGPSLRGAQRGPDSPALRAAAGSGIFIQATLKGARRARCIVGAAAARFREEAEGAKRTGKCPARGGGARHQA